MHQVAKDLNYSLHFWSVVDGLVDSKNGQSKQANDPLEALLAIQELKEKNIILLRDFLGLLRFDGQEIGKSCKMKSIKDNPVKIRRKFDQNFKREALQNWFNSGKSAEVIAGELGLNSNLLYAWKKRFAPDGTGQRAPAAAKPGSVADLQAQLDAAHRENRHLREQRDILKKTLGILSEPPASVMNGSTR
jgi:transposase-like protein